MLLSSEIISHLHMCHLTMCLFVVENGILRSQCLFLSLTCIVTLREWRLSDYVQLAWLIALSHHLHTLTYCHSKEDGQLSTMPLWKSKTQAPYYSTSPMLADCFQNTLQFTGALLALLFCPRYHGWAHPVDQTRNPTRRLQENDGAVP